MSRLENRASHTRITKGRIYIALNRNISKRHRYESMDGSVLADIHVEYTRFIQGIHSFEGFIAQLAFISDKLSIDRELGNNR